MTPEQAEEAVRILRYLVQKVGRYAEASAEGKGVIHAKWNMLGAKGEADDFLKTLKGVSNAR